MRAIHLWQRRRSRLPAPQARSPAGVPSAQHALPDAPTLCPTAARHARRREQARRANSRREIGFVEARHIYAYAPGAIYNSMRARTSSRRSCWSPAKASTPSPPATPRAGWSRRAKARRDKEPRTIVLVKPQASGPADQHRAHHRSANLHDRSARHGWQHLLRPRSPGRIRTDAPPKSTALGPIHTTIASASRAARNRIGCRRALFDDGRRTWIDFPRRRRIGNAAALRDHARRRRTRELSRPGPALSGRSRVRPR